MEAVLRLVKHVYFSWLTRYSEHLLDETEFNIRFVLPGQMILGEAKLSLTSLDRQN